MKQIPMKEFFKNKDNYNYALSPDGTKFLFSKTYKKRVNIWLRDLASGEEKPLTTQQKRNITNYSWKNNDSVLYYQDNDGDENHHLFLVNIVTNETVDLSPYKDVKVISHQTLNFKAIKKGEVEYKDKIVIIHNKRDKSAFDYYLKDIKTLSEELIWEATAQTSIALFDQDILKPKYIQEQKSGKAIFHSFQNGKLQKLLEISSKDAFSIVDYNEAKDQLYVLSNLGIDKIALYTIDLDLSLKTKNKIYDNKYVDLAGVILDPLTRKLLYVTYHESKKVFHYFDAEYKAEKEQRIKELLKIDSTVNNTVLEYSKNYFIDGKDMMTSYASDSLPKEFVFDKNKCVALSKTEEFLNPDNLAVMQPIKYKARDGLTIHGYLTIPKNTKGPIPFIVNPHGGPWVRDTWGYNSEVQYLVNRGFGVLQPNFRISTGYGKDFFLKGWKQWGLTCQDDLTDGTNWLIEQGYTKPGQIAIYGGSYGGYATLMGIIREPDLYSAAIDYVGVSDLFSFWDGFPEYWKSKGNIFEEAMGNPYENEELAKKVSPIYHVDKIKTPLMIVQGGQDPRVPQKQADLIYNKLKDRGVKVEYLLKKDEGHGFANEENRFELYEKMIEFLNRHLIK